MTEKLGFLAVQLQKISRCIRETSLVGHFEQSEESFFLLSSFMVKINND